MKTLAGSTRRATDQIGTTIDKLGVEAGQVVDRIEAGGKASSEAKASIASIETTMLSVTELVEEVDKQNDQIARSTGTISGHVDRVSQVIRAYDVAAIENEKRLEQAHENMAALELTASEMFDRFVKAGLSPEDSQMAQSARAFAARIVAIAEDALAQGNLTTDALFDQNYIEIPGSNPKRYRTKAMDWAHEHWRPVLDEVEASDPRIQAGACTDMNGYLPTHLTRHSQAPTGDLSHDTKYCRNGLIMLDGTDVAAKKSDDDYMMAVYRHEGMGSGPQVVRNVYVPLIIKGRRWGDFELAYVL